MARYQLLFKTIEKILSKMLSTNAFLVVIIDFQLLLLTTLQFLEIGPEYPNSCINDHLI